MKQLFHFIVGFRAISDGFAFSINSSCSKRNGACIYSIDYLLKVYLPIVFHTSSPGLGIWMIFLSYDCVFRAVVVFKIFLGKKAKCLSIRSFCSY